jgi:hypothetical protein
MSSCVQSRVVWWKSIDVSEGYIASIFRVEDKAKEQTGMKQVANRAQLAVIFHIINVGPSGFAVTVFLNFAALFLVYLPTLVRVYTCEWFADLDGMWKEEMGPSQLHCEQIVGYCIYFVFNNWKVV